jgi:hypothetical protein
MGVRGRRGERPTSMADWHQLTREVGHAGPNRVIISSEWLCQASDEQVHQVVGDLSERSLQVVFTLRPLGKILPSSWQQYIQNGARFSYESFLRGMLRKAPYDKPTPTFWRRHRHDLVVARWVTEVGADNVTVVVLDEHDHDMLFRQFEALLALPVQTLVAERAAKANRSLSGAEAELMRMINVQFHRQGHTDELYRHAIRQGVLPALAELGPDRRSLAPIATPPWALERAAELDAEMSHAIKALGIRIVGDLDTLSEPARAGVAVRGAGKPRSVPMEVAVGAIMAGISGGQQFGLRQHRTAREFGADVIDRLSPRQRDWARRRRSGSRT